MGEKMSKPPTGQRGRNNYKIKDGVRALRTARSGGMKPGMLEIETRDGTIFRVFDLEATAAKQATQGTDLDNWMAKHDARPA